MKKILLAVAAVVLSSNVYAKCTDHEAPFIGINDGKGSCCLAFKDADDTTHHLNGEAKTTLASNKNFNLAKCQIEIPVEYIDEIVAPVSGRTQLVDGCGIHRVGKGNGGFTISLDDGVINGNCKVGVTE